MLDPKTISLLGNQLNLEEEFRKLYDKIKTEDQEEAEPAEGEEEEGHNKEADMAQLAELSTRIKQSIRNIVRFFHENKEEFKNLIVGHKRSGKVSEFVALFTNQYDVFRQKMITSKEEEDSKAEQLQQLEEKVGMQYNQDR
ncbi:MAG: hypothetical protein P4L67_04070 [Candidatus Pacebacteria bacterium]|nr:hypothetical protein [Candidatus Paceibacterota bacterium]